MKILVTGGAGYIGSVAVEQLIAAGEAVVVFDNLSQGHRAAVHPGAAFVEGDLADRANLDAVLAEHRPDAVMHFASKTLVGESMQQPFLYLGDNVTNGLNLLQSMVRHGVKRFILSSTANLFDRPERMPIDETERIVPGSPYGESKFILERMLHWMDRIHGVRFACLRYFNAAGATAERGEDHAPEYHLRARLQPRGRSGPGPHSGPAGVGRGKPVLQFGQWGGLFRAAGDRCGPADYRATDCRRSGPAAAGRSGRVGGGQQQDSPGVGLAAAVSAHPPDHRDRLALAPGPSARLRQGLESLPRVLLLREVMSCDADVSSRRTGLPLIGLAALLT